MANESTATFYGGSRADGDYLNPYQISTPGISEASSNATSSTIVMHAEVQMVESKTSSEPGSSKLTSAASKESRLICLQGVEMGGGLVIMNKTLASEQRNRFTVGAEPHSSMNLDSDFAFYETQVSREKMEVNEQSNFGPGSNTHVFGKEPTRMINPATESEHNPRYAWSKGFRSSLVSLRDRLSLTKPLQKARPGLSADSRKKLNSAMKFARKEARSRLRQQRLRAELRSDILDCLKSFALSCCVVMALGTCLFLVERDDLYKNTRDKFIFADRLDEGYCAWMGAVYIGYLASHRVGYGDIPVTSAAGKWLVMLFASLTTPLTVIFTLKCSKLLKRLVQWPAKKYIEKYGGTAVDAFYVTSFVVMLLFLMLVNMVFLVTLRGPDGERLNFTDAFWYSWATYTTVGYGDIGFATLPSVTLVTWAIQYSFFVIGAVLMDTLVSCAYVLYVNTDSDGASEMQDEGQ